MSVKALYLCLKLTEELRGTKHTENSEGRASARLFIKSRRIGRAASRHWAGSQSRPGLRRVRSLNPAEQKRGIEQVATSSATVAQPEDPPPAEPPTMNQEP
jgi:hypothetical protein